MNIASSGFLPYGGLYPTRPQVDAGILIDPPMSEPVQMVEVPEASEADDPPEEPPDVKLVFQGFLVIPHRRDQVKPAHENSGVAVRA